MKRPAVPEPTRRVQAHPLVQARDGPEVLVPVPGGTGE
jgi:hypothetical protein